MVTYLTVTFVKITVLNNSFETLVHSMFYSLYLLHRRLGFENDCLTCCRRCREQLALTPYSGQCQVDSFHKVEEAKMYLHEAINHTSVG